MWNILFSNMSKTEHTSTAPIDYIYDIKKLTEVCDDDDNGQHLFIKDKRLGNKQYNEIDTITPVGNNKKESKEPKEPKEPREPREIEPLLQPDENRFVMFPIQHHDVWELYKKCIDSFWKVEDVDLSKDLTDWKQLTDDERNFIKMVLAFFAASDGVIVENLSTRFMSEIQAPEIRAFYSFQNFMENIHCVTGNTKILTDNGYLFIEDLEEQHVNVWNGTEFTDVTVLYTGNQEIYRVELSNGMELECTPGHKWLISIDPDHCKIERVETTNLKIGDVLEQYHVPVMKDIIDPNEFMNPYMHGFFCGSDTYFDKCSSIYLYEDKEDLLPYFKYTNIKRKSNYITFCIDDYINKPKFEVPINYSLKTKLQWLEGFVDANGNVSLNTINDEMNLKIISTNLQFVLGSILFVH